MSEENELIEDDAVDAGEPIVSDAEIGFSENESSAAADEPQSDDLAGGPAPSPVAPPAEAAFSLREYAVQQGLAGLRDAPNDQVAAQQLIGWMAQQRQREEQTRYQLHQYQQQLAANQQQAQRVQQMAPAQPQYTPPARQQWEAPEFNQAWLELVTRDQEGNLVAKPGVQPDLPQKILAYATWKQEQEQKFWSNPAEFVAPMLQEQIQQQARQIFQAEMSQRQNQHFIESHIRDNADWLYEKDPTGNIAVDPYTNRPVQSVYGQRYIQHMYAAQQMGIMSDQGMADYARRQLRADLIESQQQSAAQQSLQNQQMYAQTNTQLKTRALQNGATRRQDRAGTYQRNTSAPRAGHQNPRLSLKQAMARDMVEAGIMDPAEAAQFN
jgi:hypothetical protein